jgi:hypothetical protein
MANKVLRPSKQDADNKYLSHLKMTELQKDVLPSFLEETLLLNNSNEKMYFYDYSSVSPDSCKFRIEHENSHNVRRTVLSTEKTKQFG